MESEHAEETPSCWVLRCGLALSALAPFCASLWFPMSGLARLLLQAEHPVSQVPGTVLGTGLMYA